MQLTQQNKKPGILFIKLGIICILLSLLFGLIGSLQYVFPKFLIKDLSFQQTRPLHVYLAISWIVFTAVGLVYNFIAEIKETIFSNTLCYIHFTLQSSVIIIAVGGFFGGFFNGREYLEFPAWLNFIVLSGWILFAINFFKTINTNFKNTPVYIWQWATGIIFFFITMSEAQLWLLPYFNNNIVRDVTIQWKALGSMVGAWNMLIYGSSMYLMAKISDDESIAQKPSAYFFYFLGLTNLMFNWGHHTYIVPASPIVKNVSFIISMTELLILANIIYNWKKSKPQANKQYSLTTKVIYIADIWVLLNLILALAISVPYLNSYTHGTHITIAHAMGATIGINTFFLIAGIIYLLEKKNISFKQLATIKTSINIAHVSLLVFWIILIAMGVVKLISQLNNDFFAATIEKLQPYFKFFSASGIVLALSLAIVLIHLFKVIKNPSTEMLKD